MSNTARCHLSQKLIDWIKDDDRVNLEYDAENDIIITIFEKDRYIFENLNMPDSEYLKMLDITKHNLEDIQAKKNIKKVILEAQYYLETGIVIHDMQVQP